MIASSASQTRAALSATHQHRLNIRRRAGDHTQDFTRRGLLLQRLLEFVEQPDVFDGDHRLIGEGFESLICAGVKGAPRCDVRSVFQRVPPADEGERPRGAKAADGTHVGKSF